MFHCAGKQLEGCVGPAGRGAGTHTGKSFAQLLQMRRLSLEAFAGSVPKVRCPLPQR